MAIDASKYELGDLIDAMDRVRDQKKEIQKKVKDLDYKEKELKQLVIQAIEDSRTTGARGHRASASISRKIVPTAKDWTAVERFIYRHKELSLMEKRLSTARYRELLEERPRGVPGIETFEKVDLNLSKISK